MDLFIYGFYCLEAAVAAAAEHQGWNLERTHPAKSRAAKRLSQDHGLPDVSQLLVTLNDARKSEAYGDVERPPGLSPEDIAAEVEAFVDSVAELIDEDEH